MKKTFSLLLAGLFLGLSAQSQIFTPTHKIVCYFTHPVDNTVSKGQLAIPLIRTGGDTLISYINRAKYSLDIALYDYVEDSLWYEMGYVPPIHTAINNAYNRGVKIRWICNTIDSNLGFQNAITPNYGLAMINKNIPILQSPSGGSYGIMHNKFVIIDGSASDPNTPIVWTGSMNWEPGQIDKDDNNIIIIQDSGVAHAYRTEFNQMWGDTVEGGKYNTKTSLFGPYKKNITRHTFNVGANNTSVEVYFSPSDQTNNHIISSMQMAKSEVDVSMFTFTYTADDQQMITEHKNGIFVSCLMDDASISYQPWTDLSNALNTNVELYNPGTQSNGAPKSIDHNKFMIVDPCDTKGSPLVFTGSHNWSASANTANDENSIIVHDSTIANLYYQAYRKSFMTCPPVHYTLTTTCPVTVGAGIDNVNIAEGLSIYPNPADKQLSVVVNLASGKDIQYKIYNVMGQMVSVGKLVNDIKNTINISSLSPGIYMLAVQNGNKQLTKKFNKE